MSLLPRADVLLMTVSDAETRAVLDAMAEVTGQQAQGHPRGDRTFYDLGTVAKTRVWLVRSERGSSTPGGAFATLSTALPELRPLAILLVGAATGLSSATQQLGDILVSHQLMAYEPQRLGTAPDGAPVVIPRGDKATASTRPLDRCRAAALYWTAVPVRFGLLLSGEKQLEHAPSVEQFQAHEREAIGVEQEGVALYTAAHQHKLDWLVIKAIAGWPDGSGGQEERAARNAAAFAAHLLAQGGFAPTHEQMEALALLEELPTEHLPTQVLPLPALSRIPFAPNPQFVGRTEELCALARQLKDNQTVAITSGEAKIGAPAVITTGIGGVGKTQLAIELAHRYGGYFKGGVFWLSCADPASIAGEVAACGLRGLVTRPDYAELKQAEQVEAVLAAWQEPTPRLLIFDNCEDEALLQQWQPKTGGCRVLVTSRQATWSTTLNVRMLALDVLPRADSVMLLQQLAPHLAEEEADQIAQALGDLPLALHLAGCYLARYRTPVDQYLERLARVQFLPHPSLQGRGVKTMPTDREPHVEKAFALSFERLSPDDPIDDLARHLLARAACFAPGELFGRSWLEATIIPEGDEEEQQLARTDAVERLLGLGLLESVAEGGVRLHRLLAAYAALALSDAEALPAVERVVCRVARWANETKMPQMMLPVLPHLRHLVQGAEGREDEVAVVLFDNLGFYLNLVGSYPQAQTLMERMLVIRERVLGVEHPDTTTSLNNLAELLRKQGAYEDARPLLEQALAIREQVLGADHPDTAQSLDSLGGLLQALGAYEEARRLLERALTIREQVLGADHPDTATSLNNLAGLLREQGAYEKARPLLERALAIQEQELGADHPDIAQSLNNLAGLLQALGVYEEARPLLERALAIRERVLGTDHPDTATSLNNLAKLFREQGANEGARPLLERALAIHERVLGADHPDTASSLSNLAGLLQAEGDYGKARSLYERALAIYERVLGACHPLTAIGLNNLAHLLKVGGAYEKARLLYERALAIHKQVLGAEHPQTALSLNNLATVLEAQEAYAEARLLYERALSIRERVLGGDHPDTAMSLHNLAVYHINQENLTLVLPLLERAITIWQVQFGATHPTVVKVQQSLAEFHRSLLEAIIVVGQGDDKLRTEIEAILVQLEARGFHLTAAVQALWTGERNVARLTQDLDSRSCLLVRHLLTMFTEAEAAKRRADLLARAEARVAAVGDDPQARVELTERLAVVAASYASGSPADQALAAQLQALIDQLRS